ncbi:hypothetical protein R76727_04131 [Ralstonia mannitolilytica]|jgi:hypothetical protein|nr:hypothetical protein R76727_04131 [Ralstonia mannitolilytica]
MKFWSLLRVIFGALLGMVAATAICWGALYMYGTYYLHGHGSLFDTNPTAANAFFAAWFSLMAAGSAAGGYLAWKR